MYMTIVDVRGPSCFGPFPNRLVLQRFADYWGYRQYRVLKDRPSTHLFRNIWKPVLTTDRFHTGMGDRPQMPLVRSEPEPEPRGYTGPFSHPLLPPLLTP